MGERFLPVTHSDRAVEQAIVALKKGAHILKYGRRGKPKLCPFRLSTDERTLMWFSGKEEKQLQLCSVTSIVRGHGTRKLQTERESHSFSLIYVKNQAQYSLDLICKDKMQADLWFLGLKSVISRCQNFNRFENRRGTQSCVSSPTSFIRRKYNLGLKETLKMSQVRSVSGSPSFSDGLSVSSDSFVSGSSLSSMHNSTDNLIQNPTYIKPGEHKKNPKMLSRFVAPSLDSPHKPKKTELNDVLIWGERAENDVSDALLPKVLDSVSTLDVANISFAGKQAALVTKSGEVFCWGERNPGRLGHTVSCLKIMESLTGVHVKSVSCGEYQTCAVTSSGELYTWGETFSGETFQWLPRRVSGVLDGIIVAKLACGEWHTAVVSNSGELFTFGDGTFGVLGHGNSQSLTHPKKVDSINGFPVRSVACGPWHTAAVVAGKLCTWGDGDKGRLGHFDQTTKLKPTLVSCLSDHDFVQVTCGRMLTVGLTTTGVVYTIGSSVHGQLGNPMACDKSITIVQGKLKFEFVKEISSGSYHVAVLTSKGNVYVWGKNENGQLGLGDTKDRITPTLIETLKTQKIKTIISGSNSTAVICLHKSITCGQDQLVCRGCGFEFGFIRKKHNCYNCGFLFCSNCSNNKIKNACLAPVDSKYFRVCDSCFKMSKIEDVSPRPLLIKDVSEDINSRSLLMNHVGRWGQVSSPASFRKYCEEECGRNDVNVESRNSINVKESRGERTGKRKVAKEVIKALTSTLHLMSPRVFARKQATSQLDAPATNTINSTGSATRTPNVAEVSKTDNSTFVSTMHNTSPSDEPVSRSKRNETKQKHEWTEQYQPGVYITFVMLPTGQKGIKRVRFSKKVFREREAEKWWEDNQQKVYDHYDVNGYINSY